VWIDERLIVHTADARWDSVLLLSEEELALLRQAHVTEVFDVLDDVEDQIFATIETQPVNAAEEESFKGRMPEPATLPLAGPSNELPSRVAAQLAKTPLRWRLDHVWSIRDCLRALG
jgi:hypothetical protein